MHLRVLFCLSIFINVSVYCTASEWVTIDDGDSGQWIGSWGLEFLGARMTFCKDKAPDNAKALEVKVDLAAGGKYAGVQRDFPFSDTNGVRFQIWSEGIKNISVRLLDNSKQWHAKNISVKPGGWRTIKIPLAQKEFPVHWGGANDGVLHAPLSTFLIAADNLEGRKGKFWLRKVQVYTTESEWQLGFKIKEPGQIVFHSEQPFAPVISTFNASAQKRSTVMTWKVSDETGKLVKNGTERLNLFPGQRKGVVPQLGTLEYGYYRLETKLSSPEGEELKTADTHFAVVEKLANYGPKKDHESFFGMQLGDIFDVPAAARIGVKWDRPQRDCWVPGRFPPSGFPSGYDRPFLSLSGAAGENEFYWPDDSAMRDYKDFGFGVMMTLNYNDAWVKAISNGKSTWPLSAELLKKWGEFVTVCVKRYGEYVDCWEIQNEPDNTCYIFKNVPRKVGAQGYSALVKSAYDAIRNLGATQQICALDVSGTDYATLKFSRDVLNETSKIIDILTGHPYTHPRYFGPNQHPVWPSESQMREKIENVLKMLDEYGMKRRTWIGELGWALDRNESPDSLYAKEHAACVAQAMVIAHSVPGLERCFWFIENGCNESGYEYGLWRGNPFRAIPLQPMPSAVSYASCARFLYHVKPLGQLELPGIESACFVGDDPKRAVAVLWTLGDPASFTAELPQNTEAFSLYGKKIRPDRITLDKSPVFLVAPLDRAKEFFRAVKNGAPKPKAPVHLEKAYFIRRNVMEVVLVNLVDHPVDTKVQSGSSVVKLSLKAKERKVVNLAVREQRRNSVEVKVFTGGKLAKNLKVNAFQYPCPRRDPQVDGSLEEWGQPQAVLNKRQFILPPDPNIGWDGPEDLSAEVWWGWNEKGLCFAARITDDKHVVFDNPQPRLYWSRDSIQLGIDVNNDAGEEMHYLPDDREFGFIANGVSGKAFESAPDIREVGLPVCVKREGTYTIYEGIIPWKRLDREPEPGNIMSFNLIANDDDGNGRAYWIGLAPGIGDAKRPGAFIDLILE